MRGQAAISGLALVVSVLFGCESSAQATASASYRTSGQYIASNQPAFDVAFPFGNLPSTSELAEHLHLFSSLPSTPGSGEELTNEEHEAIRSYTGDSYTEWNRALRNGAVPAPAWQKIQAVQRGLQKLPGYRGMSYRHAMLESSTGGKYAEDMIIQERGFTSTTKRIDISSPHANHLFIIHGTSGRDLNEFGLSLYPIEQEVLFPHGTRFQVFSVRPGKFAGNGRRYERIIILVEVSR